MKLASCSCGRPQRRYKALLHTVFPSDPSREPRNLNKIVAYAKQEKKRTPMVARHLSKRLDQQIKKKNHWHAEITIAVTIQLIENADLSIFFFHVLDMIKKLLEQPEIQLRMLALETFVTYMKYRDTEDLFNDLKGTQIIPAVIRMCGATRQNGGRASTVAIYTGKKWQTGNIPCKGRNVGFRTLREVCALVPDSVSSYLSEILHVIVDATETDTITTAKQLEASTAANNNNNNNNNDVHSQPQQHLTVAGGNLVSSVSSGSSNQPTQEMTNFAVISDTPAALCQLAHNVLRAIASQHNVLTVMTLMEKLFLILDTSSLWKFQNEHSEVVTNPRAFSLMRTVSSAVQTQHSHIIFGQLFRHLDDELQLQIKIRLVDVVIFTSRSVYPAGPWVVEGLNSVIRHLINITTLLETSSSRDEVREYQAMLYHCLNVLAHRLQAHSQTTDIALALLQRLPFVKLSVLTPSASKLEHSTASENENSFLPPSNAELQEKDVLIQFVVLRCLAVVIASAPSISKTLPLPGSSKLLNHLLFATLVSNSKARLLTQVILFAIITGRPIPLVVREAFEQPSGSEISLASILDDSALASLITDGDVMPKSHSQMVGESPMPQINHNSLRIDAPYIAWSLAGTEDEKVHWQGFDRDWLALYHVIYRHLVFSNNTESNALMLHCTLDVLFRKYTSQHIETVLPVLLTAQQFLVSLAQNTNKSPDASTVLACNASHMIITYHFAKIAEYLGNDKVKTQCHMMLHERAEKFEIHPKLVFNESSGNIMLAALPHVAENKIQIVSRTIQTNLITEALLLPDHSNPIIAINSAADSSPQSSSTNLLDADRKRSRVMAGEYSSSQQEESKDSSSSNNNNNKISNESPANRNSDDDCSSDDGLRIDFVTGGSQNVPQSEEVPTADVSRINVLTPEQQSCLERLQRVGLVEYVAPTLLPLLREDQPLNRQVSATSSNQPSHVRRHHESMFDAIVNSIGTETTDSTNDRMNFSDLMNLAVPMEEHSKALKHLFEPASAPTDTSHHSWQNIPHRDQSKHGSTTPTVGPSRTVLMVVDDYSPMFTQHTRVFGKEPSQTTATDHMPSISQSDSSPRIDFDDDDVTDDSIDDDDDGDASLAGLPVPKGPLYELAKLPESLYANSKF